MDPWYDLHFRRKQFREEALQKARESDLTEQARINRSRRYERTPADRIRKNALLLLRTVQLAQ
jgi:hypothetical protein